MRDIEIARLLLNAERRRRAAEAARPGACSLASAGFCISHRSSALRWR